MKRTPRKSTLFTSEHDALLREHYRQRGQEWCARHLGRTVLQVRSRAWKLHLCRPHTDKEPPVRLDAKGVAALITRWRPAPGALDREEVCTA